jgi:hypothetical protein
MTLTINKLKIWTDRNDLPLDIHAQFNDGWRLHLRFVRHWNQCFATLQRDDETIHLEAAFRHHAPDEIQTADMTRKDWAHVCFKYRMEMIQ